MINWPLHDAAHRLDVAIAALEDLALLLVDTDEKRDAPNQLTILDDDISIKLRRAITMVTQAMATIHRELDIH